jgi:hypothetical protein
MRALVLVVGLGVVAYGVLRLLDLGWANTRAALEWLVAGVVLHDAVFAPAVIVVALVALRLLPRRLLAPWTAALVVLVPVTLLSVPELGRFGARTDNPTLLDRPYWLGWSGVATLVVVVALAATVVRVRRHGVREDHEPEQASAAREVREVREVRGGDRGAGDGGR